MTCARTCATAALALLLAGCGYFNSMYNAQRRFRDAQAAGARGDDAAARAAYAEAIEKAARSYRSRPDGRWADDALFLIGRAHFSLGEYDAARAAMAHLLARAAGASLRADALAVRGAAELALGEAAPAAASLDSAATLGASGGMRGFLHLWRARAAFARSDTAVAWRALRFASEQSGVALEARLEAAARSLASDDPARLQAAFAELLGQRHADTATDSVIALARGAAQRFGPRVALDLLEPAWHSGWGLDARDALALERARLAARAGELDAALADTERLAESARAPFAEQARLLNVRLRLHALEEPAGLAALTAALLPAATYAPARDLLRLMGMLEVLRERSQDPLQRIALFAAAEVARDSLATPRLARRLFLDYADSAAGEPWVGKALLAALQLSEHGARADTIRKRMARHPDDLYLRAVAGGTDGGAFALAEERLARGLVAVRHDAADLAERALLASLDSLTPPAARVRRDSTARMRSPPDSSARS